MTDGLKLVRPTIAYQDQVMDMKKEIAAANDADAFAGCARLEKCETYEEWIDFGPRLRALWKKGYVPSEVYLAVRTADDRVVGIIDYRHPLSDFLRKYGGNIGYSIRPSERKKGYGSQMLGLLLPICRAYGDEKVLLTCDPANEASRRTMIRNGGIMENEIADDIGLSHSGRIQRFWIDISGLDTLSLRPLTDEDIPLVARWMTGPRAARWFPHPDRWLEEIRQRDGKYRFIHHYIACLGGRPVGFCQHYDYEKGGEDWQGTLPAKGSRSIDYLLGEDDQAGHGLGRRMVQLLTEEIRRETDAGRIIVQPEKENAISRKTLLSAGFSYDEANDVFLMPMDR